MLDVGLMGAMADVPAGMMIVGDNIFKEYKGTLKLHSWKLIPDREILTTLGKTY